MTNTITSTEPAGEPAAGSPRADSARELAARIAWIAAWMVVATLGWVTFPRLAGIAFLRRRWYLGGACVLLAVVHVVAVYPALGSRPLPAWAATAPRVTIFEAN